MDSNKLKQIEEEMRTRHVPQSALLDGLWKMSQIVTEDEFKIQMDHFLRKERAAGQLEMHERAAKVCCKGCDEIIRNLEAGETTEVDTPPRSSVG